MAGAWTQNHKGDTDWNIMTPPQPGLNGRKCHVPRGKFIGGSSGCNGTICVRGVPQDYDDWGSPEWSGDEMFRAMRKVSPLLCGNELCADYLNHRQRDLGSRTGSPMIPRRMVMMALSQLSLLPVVLWAILCSNRTNQKV